MNELRQYATDIVSKSGKSLLSCEVFAKVLTSNDDSGRHGVLIPSDAYQFFPEFIIPDPTVNATTEFPAFNALSNEVQEVAYKYYERYPERRLTRLPNILNGPARRILVVLRVRHLDGTIAYYFDCASSISGRFDYLFRLIFGKDVAPNPGVFLLREVESKVFVADDALNELLSKFDDVSNLGWIDSMRSGDTGIGYTFESLVGIKENNDQIADFRGIELKCKGLNEETTSNSAKINLFQSGPEWTQKLSTIERIRQLGSLDDESGLYSCYSQVTTVANNLSLMLGVLRPDEKIELTKNSNAVGYWNFKKLDERLKEKHPRFALVKAKCRKTATGSKYKYEELVYSEQPSISRFVDLVEKRNIVFEFTMSERKNSKNRISVRNHGYPWRLTREEIMELLFAFQIKLR